MFLYRLALLFASPGLAVDSPDSKDIAILRKSGKVAALEEEILNRES